MQLDLLLFGVTKDIMGGERYTVNLHEDANVGELRNKLFTEYPQLQKLKSLLIAVNNEYGQDDQHLKTTDEVALIPPVSGG